MTLLFQIENIDGILKLVIKIEAIKTIQNNPHGVLGFWGFGVLGFWGFGVGSWPNHDTPTRQESASAPHEDKNGHVVVVVV